MNLKKNMPNCVTCSNLISGCIATYYAFTGQLLLALIWIIIGALFDFADGLTARMLNVSSPIGKELDSLADDITFGLAPAAMAFTELRVMDYPIMNEPDSSLRFFLPFVALIMAAFSAVRLAKFNIDTRQKTSFIGLPTPANALFWGSLIATKSHWLESSPWMTVAMVVMIFVSSWLMVAEIPMFALKFKHWGWRGNEIRYIFLILSALVLALCGVFGSMWIIITMYFCISLAAAKDIKQKEGAE